MRLKWEQIGEKKYETGVSNGALYVQKDNGSYDNGVAWKGLSSVTENPSGAEPTAIYADNAKYLTLVSAEEFGLTIEAYMSPPEFDECDGTSEIATGVTIGQQDRKAFGFVYKTIIGNDTEKNAYGYKLHLIYGATAAPSEKGYNSVNESTEAMTLSWEISTTPVEVTNHKPTASITIDSTKANPEKLKALEDILFGSDESEARLPLPDEIISLMKEDVPAVG